MLEKVRAVAMKDPFHQVESQEEAECQAACGREDYLPDPRYHRHLAHILDLLEGEFESHEKEQEGDPHLRDDLDRVGDRDQPEHRPQEEAGHDVGHDGGDLQELGQEHDDGRTRDDDAQIFQDGDLGEHGVRGVG